MCMHGERRLDPEELAEVRRIPVQLARAYVAGADRLLSVRSFRDAIIHQGKEVPTVFVTERGFSILRTDPVVQELSIWTPDHRDYENLVSLRPLLAWIVMSAIDTCNIFAETLGQIFQLPPDIAPEHRVFIRSIHAPALLNTLHVLRGGSPWWSEDT